MSSEVIIVCGRVATYLPARGSVQEPCSRCGQAVWLGPTMQLKRAQTFATLQCYPCAIEDGFEPAEAILHAGVVDELRRYDEEHGGDRGLQAIMRWLASA